MQVKSLAYIMPRKKVINIKEQLDFIFAGFFMSKYSIKPK